YAWSAKIPVSILSDFEQLAVYDCRAKPVHGDPAHIGRVKLFSYQEYVSKWDELYRLFSHQAVHQGSLDQFAVGLKGKRGTADVDDAFLVEMERWREELARNIALRNPALTTRQLNSAVQLTIDRIIFLRICEERGIEAEDALRDATDGKEVYSDLLALFRQADKKYNSGLFHFSAEKGQSSHPDTLTPTLRIDDRVLKDILANLYYPKSPYAFKYIPADILGQVYERFLGKVIRLTAAHQAKVEEKPEVRKAGGVYYTPTYIVEYIVKNTVGELLKDKDPEALKHAPLRVLDPACGSGSFLLGAYQYLLDWHLDWYMQHDPAKWGRGKNPPVFENHDAWQLTMEKKKEILTSHIFGVDIDAQAVEVTKLSLLLKVVENPGQLGLLTERILPDLGENIQCGNSLIGPDYYDNQQLTMFDSEEQYRVNAFDWRAAFPQVFRDGGFDVVIGNPPYGPLNNNGQLAYFEEHYHHQDYQKDMYLLFLEQYYGLIAQNGSLGVIVSNTWLQSIKLRSIRHYLTNFYSWKRILHLPEKVFNAVVDTHVLIFQKAKSGINNADKIIVDVMNESIAHQLHILSGAFVPKNGDPINIVADNSKQDLNKKITMLSRPLENSFVVYNGIKPFEIGKGQPPQSERIVKEQAYVMEGKPPDSSWTPLLRGSLIQRYENKWENNYWVQYGKWLAAPRDPKIFEAPIKIMVRQTGDSIIATIIESGFIARNNIHIIIPNNLSLNLKYLLGLMNSKLMDFAYSFINPEKGEALAEVKKKHVEQLPIRTIDFANPADVKRHDRMVSLVESMLALHKQSAAARLPDEKERLERQIQATDRQIDNLVYELYGLTEEEIRIVEGDPTQPSPF
ncbi:MAG: Eco57I restriction-modification methylase domain-containing protein, partial [Bellilinea sp.]